MFILDKNKDGIDIYTITAKKEENKGEVICTYMIKKMIV